MSPPIPRFSVARVHDHRVTDRVSLKSDDILLPVLCLEPNDSAGKADATGGSLPGNDSSEDDQEA